jgi:hypothetical protein
MHALEKAADFRNRTTVPVTPNNAGRSVVVVFDELDAGLVRTRPSRIQMSAWDRLTGESWNALDARSPGASTLVSIPSILTGRRAIESAPESTDTLTVRWEGAHAGLDWKQENVLFKVARASGLNVGISGWYHPYCRLFGNFTSSCFWAPAAFRPWEEWSDDLNLLDAASRQFRRVVYSMPGLVHLGLLKFTDRLRDPAFRNRERTRRLETYAAIHAQAVRMVADPGLNLVYLHYSIPHMLTIYDGKAGSFSTADGNNYFDNLLLVDRTIAELRSSLERSGLWDKTNLLVTSDHPFRVELYHSGPEWDEEQESAISKAPDRRVPFMLKLAGQARGARYTEALDTVVLKDLILAAIRGKVTSGEEIQKFLRENRPLRSNAITQTHGMP